MNTISSRFDGFRKCQHPKAIPFFIEETANFSLTMTNFYMLWWVDICCWHIADCNKQKPIMARFLKTNISLFSIFLVVLAHPLDLLTKSVYYPFWLIPLDLDEAQNVQTAFRAHDSAAITFYFFEQGQNLLAHDQSLFSWSGQSGQAFNFMVNSTGQYYLKVLIHLADSSPQSHEVVAADIRSFSTDQIIFEGQAIISFSSSNQPVSTTSITLKTACWLRVRSTTTSNSTLFLAESQSDSPAQFDEKQNSYLNSSGSPDHSINVLTDKQGSWTVFIVFSSLFDILEEDNRFEVLFETNADDKCVFMCDGISHAIPGQASEENFCNCEKGYFWALYMGRCISCSDISHAFEPHSESSHCECEDYFYWNQTLQACELETEARGPSIIGQTPWIYQRWQNKFILIGGAVGGGLVLMMICMVCLVVRRRKLKQKEKQDKQLMKKKLDTLDSKAEMVLDSRYDPELFKQGLFKDPNCPVCKSQKISRKKIEAIH